MKKILALVLALVMVFALVACGASAEEETAAIVRNADVDPALAEALVSDAFIDPVTEWATYDEMIAAIKAETDMAKRTELMHEAEDVLMSNYCVIPFYYYNDLYMQKDYVTGIYSNPFATKFFMYAEMSNGSDTLRINLASEPDYLDPALNSSVDGACLAANSFSGLYTYNAEGVTEPACATGYEVSEDGLTYTVTLREGLKWSNGDPLTASDFVYSWNRAVAAETAADYAYMFSGIDGYDEGKLNIEAVDDTTFKFVLSAPCAYMEDLMAFPTFYPVHQASVEANSTDTDPGAWCKEAGFVSNGAYVCTDWQHKTSMTYEKNPYWYNADEVTVEKLEFMLSDDDTAILAAYEAGDLDFADSVPTDEIARLQDSPEFYVVDELGTYYAAFNCKSSLFDGMTAEQAACVRNAFSIVIDRDYIVENIGQTGQKVANSFIPLGQADGNGGVFKTEVEDGYFDAYAINDDYEGTLAQARELMEAAGFEFGEDGKLVHPFTLTYLTNTSSGHIAVAEAIQQDLAALGINIVVEQQEWAVFLEERKNGNFDFAREGWIADFNDPINMLEMWTTDSGNNDCQFGR